MERSISEKEKNQILNFGAFEYNAEYCANVLDWDKEEVELLLKNKKSSFYKLYNTGRIRAQYVIDLKLFEQAQTGDLKSLEKLELRKRVRK